MSRIDGKQLQGEDYFLDEPTGTVNGSNTSFSLTETPSDSTGVHVYMDGLLLLPSEYSVTGTTITMTTAPAFGQKLLAVYIKEN